MASDISRIATYLSSGSREVVAASIDALAALVTSLHPDRLPFWEDVIRARWRSCYRPDVHAGVLLLESKVQDSAHTALLSFDPDGYHREIGVARLARIEDGSEVPYLVLRLDDWVLQVREPARRAVTERMREEYAAAFVRCFSLIDRAIRLRPANSVFIEPLARTLATEHGAAALVKEIESCSPRTGRSLMRFVFEHVPALLPTVMTSAVRSADAVVRAQAAARVGGILHAAESFAILGDLTRDHSAVVRRASLTAMMEVSPAGAHPYLERALLDSSSSIREQARFFLGSAQGDFASVYKSALATAANAKQLTTAIAAISEVGQRNDAELVVPFLKDSRSAVRRAALKCVMRLSGETFVSDVLPMLLDDSAAVSAAARDTLQRHLGHIGAPELRQLYSTASSPHARRNVVLLFAELPKWQSITCLLEAAAVDDSDVASLGRRLVTDWNRTFNRRQMVPGREEVDAVTAALAAAGDAIDERTAAEIRLGIRAFE